MRFAIPVIACLVTLPTRAYAMGQSFGLPINPAFIAAVLFAFGGYLLWVGEVSFKLGSWRTKLSIKETPRGFAVAMLLVIVITAIYAWKAWICFFASPT